MNRFIELLVIYNYYFFLVTSADRKQSYRRIYFLFFLLKELFEKNNFPKSLTLKSTECIKIDCLRLVLHIMNPL